MWIQEDPQSLFASKSRSISTLQDNQSNTVGIRVRESVQKAEVEEPQGGSSGEATYWQNQWPTFNPQNPQRGRTQLSIVLFWPSHTYLACVRHKCTHTCDFFNEMKRNFQRECQPLAFTYVPKHTQHVYKGPGDRVTVQVENFLMRFLSKHETDIRFLGDSLWVSLALSWLYMWKFILWYNFLCCI